MAVIECNAIWSLLKPGDDSGSHTGRVRKRVWICSQVCQSYKIGAFWMKGERQGKRERGRESKSPVWLAHQRKKLLDWSISQSTSKPSESELLRFLNQNFQET
ncbi:hypothetical protein MHYP_G00143910 [Metynnis hypsauchen]